MKHDQSALVWARIEGFAGRLTLRRPQALNALTHAMCLQIAAALAAWKPDPRVRLVIIDAEGERAFCAGGDVRRAAELCMAGHDHEARNFFRAEYRMNAELAAYPKPIMAFMQGYVLGGGVGLGCHLPWRVTDPAARFAMPEVAIGFVPDVGASLLLARAPQRIGVYAGLTAMQLSAPDAVFAGMADHIMPLQNWPKLIASICESGDPSEVLQHAETMPLAPLANVAAQIAAVFEGWDLGTIQRRLANHPSDWAQAAQRAMAAHSPLAMVTSLALLASHAAGDRVQDALRREYRIMCNICSAKSSDFIEGVRARLIDKDQQPRWRHASVAEVGDEAVAALLAPLQNEDFLA